MLGGQHPVPSAIPGQLVADPERLGFIKEHIAMLCRLGSFKCAELPA